MRKRTLALHGVLLGKNDAERVLGRGTAMAIGEVKGKGVPDGDVVLCTREQAEGAIPNGTVIRKVTDAPGDRHRIGDRGIVLGSMKMPRELDSLGRGGFLYFIDWEDEPGVPIACTSDKIEAEKAS